MAAAAALLFKCRADDGIPENGALRAALAAVAAAHRLEVARIAAYAAQSAPEVYTYLWLAAPREIDAEPPGSGSLLAGMPAEACALQRVDSRAGASHGADAPFHYVVEMDFAPGRADDIKAWYEGERPRRARGRAGHGAGAAFSQPGRGLRCPSPATT